jgi:hypothetical protein
MGKLMPSMTLLVGADITARYDFQSGEWTVTVIVGTTSTRFTAGSLDVAIGQAVLRQSNITPGKVRKMEEPDEPE